MGEEAGGAGGSRSERVRASGSPPERGGPPAATRPPHVVATAGHVDHGKSSLILRLTGIDPDRLEEEKRRGLTIQLGYAWCTLPSGREVGFVDVPGHERFVRTMLAGVGPVRLVLFVVAADEGWKPQSEEHLSIVDVLGVEGGVIALTKRDLVPRNRLEEAVGEVRGRVRGTALEGAPIVACSSSTGDGMDELVAALDGMVAAAPAPAEDGRSRLFADRVFAMTGAGTIVTGTLTGGPLAVGDEIEVHPSGARARIRGLQTHKRRIEIARPVSRVAVNVTGIERSLLQRGDVLTRPGDWRPTAMLEARIRALRGLRHPLTARGDFTLHAGAAERGARVRLYDVTRVPEEGAYARIRLSAPLALDVWDRFVLRESGRHETVAGGIVLDAGPPVRPGEASRRLHARERAGRLELPALLLSERGAVREQELRTLTGETAVPGAARLGGWIVSAAVLAEVEEAAIGAVTAFHAENPRAPGIELPELRRRAAEALRRSGASNARGLAGAIVDELVRRGALAREGTLLRLPGREDGVGHAEIASLVESVRHGEPTPPTITQIAEAGIPRETIDAAVRTGALVRIAPDLVLTPEFVRRAVDAVQQAGTNGISVSEVRQRLGTSRRFAVPLMEHLDRVGETRRSGDLRFARGSRPS